MSTATAHPSRSPEPSRLFADVSFAIMVGGWLAFFAALIGSPSTLDDIWATIRDLPLVVEGIVWLIGFPFLAGLMIWQASWDESIRLISIAVLATAYTYMFIPRAWKR